ncbi:UPF0725 protein [Arabidopsis thaliana]|uniref:Uncharacterized protein n=2 Tax=Arabidopsis TaxID=3701 RepID=A0A178W9A3_ARATH|nr:Protein MS5 [Arabidopsis thaliana x Arabidopsis arenosa]OAP14928.1 hypothetical protein AXX17_AT1G01930 [Arabidopsis thaliana]
MDMSVIMRYGDDKTEKLCLEVEDYWARVDESDGFDVEGIQVPPGGTPLIHYDCHLPNSRHPDPVLVKLYASAGLHRYNMLEGTNFKLVDVMKFNKLMMHLSPFYITLLAQDPVSRSQQTFQVQVDEHCLSTMDLTVLIARPKAVSTNESVLAPQSFSVEESPEWPSDFNDGKRFYRVKESELRNNDWISLYLQLVLVSHDRMRISDSDLSKLKIVEAVIETKDDMLPPNERLLNAKTAIVYITFKGFTKCRIGDEHTERNTIVRRIFDEDTGHLSIKGELIGEYKLGGDFDPGCYFNSPAILEARRICQGLPPQPF